MANILIVDDDKVLLKILKNAFIQIGHSVVTATDGYEARNILNSEMFDLLITDINLPMGITGYSLARMIRGESKYSKIPIILISGYRMEEKDIIRAAKEGVRDYFVKPIEYDKLIERAESLIKTRLEDKEFAAIPVEFSAQWSTSFHVHELSQQGIGFTFSVPMQINFRTRIQSDIFKEIGLNNPVLRVASCEPSKDKQGVYLIRAHFTGLSEDEIKALKSWIEEHNTGSNFETKKVG